MKLKFLSLLPLFSAFAVSAQLAITPGARFLVAGNAQLTLQNADLINNGSFTPGAGVVTFTGDATSSIGGSQAVQFFGLEVGKSGGNPLILLQPVAVTQRVTFTSGLLDLNGFNLDLGATGVLTGESEKSRITGAGGGQVLTNAVLNAPAAANPGNLGAMITSAKNLGNVVIKRGHQTQQGQGLNGSILRFYDISPANDAALNVTLRVTYFNAELNGIAKGSLGLFKSDDNVNWSAQGFTTRDSIAGFVEKNALGSLSRWTLGAFINALPVRYVFFDAACETNGILLSWETAEEENSSRFDIERSADDANWVIIGSLAAAGNSVVIRNYSFFDKNSVSGAFYRLAQYDLDGRANYSATLRSSCAVAGSATEFNLWPNPFHDEVFVTIPGTNPSAVTIRVLDSKGTLVAMQRSTISRGNNQLSVDLRTLASGIYLLVVDTEDGVVHRTLRAVKQ